MDNKVISGTGAKASVRVNGVSLMVDANKGKSEKDFVEEQKHNFDGDVETTKDTYRLFQEAIKPVPATKEEKK